MEKFEYKVTYDFTLNNMEDFLNSQGKAGWELVVWDKEDGRFIFKRQVLQAQFITGGVICDNGHVRLELPVIEQLYSVGCDCPECCSARGDTE